MKNDLATSIAVAVVGVIISYFVCNIFLSEIKPYKVKTVSTTNMEVAEPDPEVFNYKAVNPTVEVYIGNDTSCTEFDSDGNCLDENNQTPPEGEEE